MIGTMIAGKRLFLRILVAGGLEIHTFPMESAEDEQWLLRGAKGEPEVGGCEEGVYLVDRDPKGRRI
jgi:hypothetical protein